MSCDRIHRVDSAVLRVRTARARKYSRFGVIYIQGDWLCVVIQPVCRSSLRRIQ